jgi:hypothetical protein
MVFRRDRITGLQEIIRWMSPKLDGLGQGILV